ncbi:hypothetical protein SAMN05443634_105272 [Chishuiella changwenlii]|uniref:Uncharacterized protein n=1 Tax=Chishuiella changwenlii TaxID=1434701 RepID=A0A1M6XK45_9FLAO|nr:hypothetical protein [Chishuiella changwenlii]GGF01112.1 hypothetical protein GCM10010984_18240 [Chishuiella changwenlii]SHL06185.1 hypothetical protein SAMN05443634_105272 [Chishuiella changwenlii]
MKKKKSLSKIDYYLMFIDNFKDQFTIVLSINLVLFFAINQLHQLFPQVFLQARFHDYFELFSYQFDLKEFFEVLSYTYLGSFIIHLMTYKLNKTIIFRLNALLLVIASSYLWSIIAVENIYYLLQHTHLLFILAIIGQFILYGIVGNEFFQFFKKTIKQPKINHS